MLTVAPELELFRSGTSGIVFQQCIGAIVMVTAKQHFLSVLLRSSVAHCHGFCSCDNDMPSLMHIDLVTLQMK